MASLVGPLASGIAGAPGGSAEFFVQGTSELSALVYSDAHGAAAVSTTTLDEYGGATRYVEEAVDVIVRDVNGATVRTFTWIDDAKAVRLENAGFTGTLANGSTGSGGRTTVDAALLSIYASLGATDGYVDVNGDPTLIKDAIAGSTGVFFNIVSYGADASGVSDSTAAIQLAINAAQSVGGTVFVPGGTFKMTYGVSATGSITIFGTGAASILKMTSASAVSFFTFTAESHVIGVKLQHNTPTSDGAYLVVTGTRLHVYGVHFATFSGQYLSLSATGSCDVHGSYFSLATAASTGGGFGPFGAAFGGTAGGVFRAVGCVFTVTDASASIAEGSVSGLVSSCHVVVSAAAVLFFCPSGTPIQITGSRFDASGLASGNVSICYQNTATLTGCSFSSTGGGSVLLSNSCAITEFGCTLGTGVSYNSTSTSTIASREWRRLDTTLNGISYTPSCEYGVHAVTQASGATMAFANPSPDTVAGSTLVLAYLNSTGGNRTPTFGTNYLVTGATAVANGAMGVWIFKRLGGVSTKWKTLDVTTNTSDTP